MLQHSAQRQPLQANACAELSPNEPDVRSASLDLISSKYALSVYTSTTPNRTTQSSGRWTAEDRGYTTPCHIWNGNKNTSGYGIVRYLGTTTTAHRAAWQEVHGQLPPGHTLEVDHLCQIKACVRVDHLEPVSSLLNKQRNPNSFGNKTHCPRGHEYSEVNTVRKGPNNARFCRECARIHSRAYEARRKAGRTRVLRSNAQ